MKCAQCYAENDLRATVCAVCGKSIEPIRVCPSGHVLPVGATECPQCPVIWPALTPHHGPACLRGVVWPAKGRLYGLDPHAQEPVDVLELRDSDSPISFVDDARGGIRAVRDDLTDCLAKLAVRPSGLVLCIRRKPSDPAPMTYEPLVQRQRFAVGETTLGVALFSPPTTAR